MEIDRAALPAGDCGLQGPAGMIAEVERKTLENFPSSLSDGTLAFQMQRLAEVPRAAVVVEANYPDMFRIYSARGAWLAAMLGRLAVRYPEIPVILTGSRKFAEEWAYRFLISAAEDDIEI
ncbi:MAG: ERCC4 domain-containing protein [Actinomycetota bacterium]